MQAPILPTLQIAELCRTYGVQRLDLFGSAARGDFVPGKSDYDFLVEFRDPAAPGSADRFLGLAEGLEYLLGASVDLLTTRALRNPHLQRKIENERRTLFAA